MVNAGPEEQGQAKAGEEQNRIRIVICRTVTKVEGDLEQTKSIIGKRHGRANDREIQGQGGA